MTDATCSYEAHEDKLPKLPDPNSYTDLSPARLNRFVKYLMQNTIMQEMAVPPVTYEQGYTQLPRLYPEEKHVAFSLVNPRTPGPRILFCCHYCSTTLATLTLALFPFLPMPSKLSLFLIPVSASDGFQEAVVVSEVVGLGLRSPPSERPMLLNFWSRSRRSTGDVGGAERPLDS